MSGIATTVLGVFCFCPVVFLAIYAIWVLPSIQADMRQREMRVRARRDFLNAASEGRVSACPHCNGAGEISRPNRDEIGGYTGTYSRACSRCGGIGGRVLTAQEACAHLARELIETENVCNRLQKELKTNKSWRSQEDCKVELERLIPTFHRRLAQLCKLHACLDAQHKRHFDAEFGMQMRFWLIAGDANERWSVGRG
jgi:hypothetical protein